VSYWKTEKINLRAIEPSDAHAVMSWHEDSELSRHMDFLHPPQSLASIKRFIESETNNKLEGDRYFWIIENSAADIVGHIDTRCNTRHRNFEYGVSIASKFQRLGYGSLAISKILDYYFNQLGYHKAMAGVHSDNLASRALHESLGFCLEGSLREMIFTNGRYVDMLQYGQTATEFNKR